jgi:hypothetical protein
MKRRHSFLLLEMMIALVIMAGVTALLFSGFYSAIHGKNIVKKERERILNLQRLKLRFAVLFKDIIDIKPISENAYYILYKGGIDHNPGFRGEVESILKLNNKALTLTTWAEKEEPRRELIGENISSIHFLFFDAAEGKFTPEYPKQKPPMMKVVLNQNDKETLPLFL